MRTFIASDFHINESKRFDDMRYTLTFILQQIKERRPHFVVILGDVFDKRRPTPKEMRCLNQWLMEVRELVVDKVILLEGNHDQDRGISSLSYLSDLKLRRIEVVTPPVRFKDFYFGHEQIEGAVADNGIVLEGGTSLNKLVQDNPSTRVFAFGHFHKPQVLRAEPLIFYAGSVINKTFGERDDEKALWFFNDKRLETIKLPTRKMYQFDIKVKENTNMETIDTDAPWNTKDLLNAMVKIVFHGTRTALKQIDKDDVAKLKENKGLYSLTVAYNVTDKTKPRNEKITESITEETALKEYFNSKELDESIKENAIIKGIDLISEVKGHEANG